MASGNVEEDEGWQQVQHKSKKRIDHPIFKKLCIASGEVNSLSKKEIQARLKAEGLPSRYPVLKLLYNVIHIFL